jgi:hypothetical protein
MNRMSNKTSSNGNLLAGLIPANAGATSDAQTAATMNAIVSAVTASGAANLLSGADGLLSGAAKGQDAVEQGISRLTETLNQSASALAENTAALGQNTAAGLNLGRSLLSGSGLPGLSGGGSIFSGLSPIISGIISLFHHSSPPPAPVLTPFSLPDSLSWQQGVSGQNGGLSAVSYSSDGLPRVAGSPAPSAAPQITFNVQAMDARSFMDYSSQIASALKSAMLHSHDVNDVLTELS